MGPEELLKKLLKYFFVNAVGGLEWMFRDGVSIDKELQKELLVYLPDHLRHEIESLDKEE